VIRVSAAKFSPAATMPSVIPGTVLDVVLGAVFLSLTVDPYFAIAV
jgi:hypothetical protein